MELEKKVKIGRETLIIRKYEAGRDDEKVLELWKTAFENEMPFDLWRWKYIDNPYETAILVCENEKNMPVVLYGGIPFKSNFCGKKVWMIHLSDIMSHPDYRGSGLFIHTANAYFDTFGNMAETFLMYGFPGKYHFDIGAKYLEYSPIGRGAAYFTEKTKTFIQKKGFLPGKIFKIEMPDPCFDELWKRCEESYPLAVIRDSAFMKWRFFDHPFNDYEVWGIKYPPMNKCRGIMVLRLQDDKAVIVDMVVSKSEKKFNDFICDISEMLFKKGIKKIETWVPKDHLLVEIIKNSGFKSKKEPIGIIPTIRIFDESLEYEWACRNIFYTMGDCDLF